MKTLVNLVSTAALVAAAVGSAHAQTSATSPSTQQPAAVGVTPEAAAEANRKAVPNATGTVVRTGPTAADKAREVGGAAADKAREIGSDVGGAARSAGGTVANTTRDAGNAVSNGARNATGVARDRTDGNRQDAGTMAADSSTRSGRADRN